MASKWNRQQIGKITKKDKDKQRYPNIPEFTLQVSQDITLKAGSYLNLENKAFKLASLEANKEKMSKENYEKAFERISNMQEWLFFEVISLSKEA
jgi:hypothetical protein